jgi:hypothetical protein
MEVMFFSYSAEQVKTQYGILAQKFRNKSERQL